MATVMLRIESIATRAIPDTMAANIMNTRTAGQHVGQRIQFELPRDKLKSDLYVPHSKS